MIRVLEQIVIVFGSGDFFSLLINKRSLNWKREPQWEFILLLVHVERSTQLSQKKNKSSN